METDFHQVGGGLQLWLFPDHDRESATRSPCIVAALVTNRGRRVDARSVGETGYPALLPFTRCTRASLRGRGSPTSGMAGDLHGRLFQHFVRRDSSVVAAAAVRLDLDYIRYVDWWEHERFGDEATQHAAELVAFDVFEPVLRSRGSPSRAATDLYGDPSFRESTRNER
jgi:hypothetical protein